MSKSPKDKQNILIFVLFFIFWFAVAFLAKSLFSGFHLNDDHKIMVMHNDLSANGLITTVKELLLPELHSRLKPLRPLHLIFATKLFGLNYLAWSIQNLSAAVITSFLLFLFGRQTGFNIKESLLFVAFSLLGVQSIVWFHLGYDEMPAMFLLSLTLFFMAKSVYSQNKSKLYNILFVVFLVGSAYMKESFLLMVPALLFWKNLLDKKHKNISWVETIKLNLVLNVTTGMFCALSLLVIQFVLKTDLGYVSTENIPFIGYLNTFIAFIMGQQLISLKLYYILAAMFVLYLVKKDFWPRFKNYLADQYCNIVLWGLILLPQCYIYVKTGFFPRYLLPATVGYAYFIVSTLKYFLSVDKSKIKKTIINIIAFYLVFSCISITWQIANNYAQKGISLHKMLDSVEDKIGKNSIILVASEPSMINFEQTIALKIFLNNLKNRQNVYILPILTRPESDYDKFDKQLLKKIYAYYEFKTFGKIKNVEDIKIIIVFKNIADGFPPTVQRLINLSEYNTIKYRDFDLYIKK